MGCHNNRMGCVRSGCGGGRAWFRDTGSGSWKLEAGNWKLKADLLPVSRIVILRASSIPTPVDEGASNGAPAVLREFSHAGCVSPVGETGMSHLLTATCRTRPDKEGENARSDIVVPGSRAT